MASNSKRNSLLCPNCRKLISGGIANCPFCGLSKPSSRLKNNIFTSGLSNPRQVITTLISINVLMFILSVVINPQLSSLNFSPFSFLSPSSRSLLELGGTGYYPVVVLGRWWTLVSANYLHGGLLHILFNMIAIRQLAPLVMEEFGIYRTISIYTLGGIGGFIVSTLAGVQFTIGASAAVCSLIGALLYFGKSRGGVYGQAVFSQIGGWAIAIGVFGLLIPGINNWGHGGGMVAGLILGYLLGYRNSRKELLWHKLLALCCVVITVLVLLWSFFSGVLFALK